MVGDKVDVMDCEGTWHEGVVVGLVLPVHYRIHFRGWSSKWDETIASSSKRIQPAYTKVRDWRSSLQTGDVVELHNHLGRWFPATVLEIVGNRVLCKDGPWDRSVDIDSDEICAANTHFSMASHFSMAPTEVNKKMTPLLVAASTGDLSVIQASTTTAIREETDGNNNSCLHLAIKSVRAKEVVKELVKELVGRGADVNAKAIKLATPLHLVSMRNYCDVAEMLIEHGADMNARDMAQNTPLHHAALRGYHDMVRLLLHYGADPTLANAAGETPADLACTLVAPDRHGVIQQLLQDGHVGYLLKKMRAMPECGRLVMHNNNNNGHAETLGYVMKGINQDVFGELMTFFV